MAICLPGMPSRVNRAATSAMRVAPLVITTNWMTTEMMKMMTPTASEPPVTKLPKASTTWPAAAVPSCGVGQNQPRGGDVEHQPEERHGQQQRGEDGESSGRLT